MSRALLLPVLLLALLLPQAPARAGVFDPEHTRFDFQLRTRWGQRVAGRFPRYEGDVQVLGDGRHRVRVVLLTSAVDVARSPRYTAMARGERFFDAARHPRIVFESDAYAPELLARGGTLRGRLQLHGVERVEAFQLEPATCARPGRDCDIVARGSVQRDAYGMDAMGFALGRRVDFTLRVRLLENAPA